MDSVYSVAGFRLRSWSFEHDRITDKYGLSNNSIATFASPHGDKGLRGEIIERAFCDALLNHLVLTRLGFAEISIFEIDGCFTCDNYFFFRSVRFWSRHRRFAIFVSTSAALHNNTFAASIHGNSGHKDGIILALDKQPPSFRLGCWEFRGGRDLNRY